MVQDFYSLIFVHTKAKILVGIIIAILSFFFDLLLAKIFLILLILTFTDCVLGYIRAIIDKRAIVSKLMRAYAWRFVGYSVTASTLFLVANGTPNLPYLSAITAYLDDIALAFFIVQEATSIIEHLNELGIPMPQRIFANLKKVKDTIDDPADQYKASIKK